MAAVTQLVPGISPDLHARFARVEWTPARVEALARRMPKVETHLHLDGAVSPETLFRLARESRESAGTSLGGLTLEEIRHRVVVDEPRESLAAVLAAFGDVLPLLQRPEAVELAAYELVRAAAGDGTRYVEVRFAPALHVAAGLDQEAVLRSALAGLERGDRDFGVASAVIVCLIRPPAYVSFAANRAMLDLALAHRGRGVVAIDLAGDEAAAPLSDYAGLFRRAKEGGLHLTAHAGETATSGDLATALALGIERLGHGVELARQPELLAEVIRRGVAIEVNLTSNLRTGEVPNPAAHPVKGWFRAGARVALSTDDPAIFGIDLPGEYLLLHRELGFTAEELAAVALQGVDSLFLPEGERRKMRADFESEIARLLDELANTPRP